MSLCEKQDCTSKLLAKGMCNKHYKQDRRSRMPKLTTSYIPVKNVLCEECDRPVQAKMLCAGHYKAKWRRENPEKAKEENRRNHLKERERNRLRREAGLPVRRRKPTMNLQKELAYEKMDMWEFVKKEMGIA